MEDLLALFGLLVLFLGWWHQRGMKDRALREAQLRCARLGLQLLDETVQLAAMRPAKDAAGNWVWRRRYAFEFTSTGDERYRAQLEMLGLGLSSFTLPAYMTVADEPQGEQVVEARAQEPPRHLH